MANPFDDGDASFASGKNPFDDAEASSSSNPFDDHYSAPEAVKPPPPPVDSYPELGAKIAKRVVPFWQEVLGGQMQHLGENPLTAEMPAGMESGQEFEARDAKSADVRKAMLADTDKPGTLAHAGRELYTRAADDMKANDPQVPEGSLKSYAFMAVESLGQMAPGVLASFLTKSTIPTLAVMGAQTYGQQYGQARNESGRSPQEATRDAQFYALAETLPEELPMEVLMKPGKKFLPGLLKTIGAEAFQEMFTQILEEGYDRLTITPEMTWGEAFKAVRDAGIVGGMVGGGLHVATHPFNHGAEEPEAPAIDATAPAAPAAPVAPKPLGPVDLTLAAPVQPTQADIDSPLSTDAIVRGKQKMADAVAASSANDILKKNNWPGLGSRVSVDMGDGNPALGGTVHDAFSTSVDELDALAHGIKIKLDNGRSFESFAEEMKRAGVTISPEVLQSVQGLSIGDAPAPLATPATAAPLAAPAPVAPLAAPVQPAPQAATANPFDDAPTALFRGEPAAGTLEDSPGSMSHAERGRWFSHSEETARSYAGDGGKVFKVDVPADQLEAATEKHRTESNGNERLLRPEWAAKKVDTAPTGDGTRAAPIAVTHADHLAAAEKVVNTAPSDAQKEAGNYEKGHIKLHGLDIAIENPKGGERKGVDADGKPWSVPMPAAYGYIKRTTGADGEHVDTYIGPNPESDQVYVIDQLDHATKKFDEHKVMMGFNTRLDAERTYLKAFSDGKGRARIGMVHGMDTARFKELLATGKWDKPLKATAESAPASAPVEKAITPAAAAPAIEQDDEEDTAPGQTRIDLAELPQPRGGGRAPKARITIFKDDKTGKFSVGHDYEVPGFSGGGSPIYGEYATAQAAADHAKERLIRAADDAIHNGGSSSSATHKKAAQAIRDWAEKYQPPGAPAPAAKAAPDSEHKSRPELGPLFTFPDNDMSKFAILRATADNRAFSLKDAIPTQAKWMLAEGLGYANKKGVIGLTKKGEALLATLRAKNEAFELPGQERAKAASPTATPYQRGFPSYTTAELRENIKKQTDPETRKKMFAEIVARESGASTVKVTPQIGPGFENGKKIEKPAAKPERKDLGKNPDGHPLAEDDRGVRSYVESGIRISEPVGIKPGSKEVSVTRPAARDFRTEAEHAAVEKPAEAPAAYGSKNTVFTQEERAAAAARIRNRLKNQLNSGIDPEMLADGIKVAGYHVEAGARSFTDFAKAMIADLGEAVRPYLKSWYNAIRDYPGIDAEGMTAYGDLTPELIATAGKEAGQNGVQDPVPDRDAGTGAADVQPADPQREDGSALAGEGDRSATAVRAADEGRAETRERPAQERTGGNPDGADGARDADRLPRAERRAGADGRGQHAGKPDASVKGENYAIAPGALQEARGWKQKAKDNIRAIELMREINAEGRPATKAEQDALARYVGWGGIKGAFENTDGEFGEGFKDIGAKLKELLPKAEYDTARRSIQYAHYTSETIVREMWRGAERMGFVGGQVFEPGMGVGNFVGMMPPDLAAVSKYSGLELDHTTAKIARLLYPESGVRQDDFTKAPLPRDTYDMVIGNPPFADVTIKTDPVYAKHGFLLHDYFFAKSLDAVRPGGLLAFVTSAGTMNKLDTGARDYLAERANLAGAIRLPGDAFVKNAGTAVTTDIIFLRKLLPGEKADSTSWTHTGDVTLRDHEGKQKTGQMSQYFLDHPENVLGEQGFFDKLYPGRYGVKAEAGRDFAADLGQAIDKLPANVMQAAPTQQEQAQTDFASTQKKEGSFYLKDGQLMQHRSGLGRPVQKRGAGVEGGKTAAEIERITGLIPIRDALRSVYDADLRGDEANSVKARSALNKAYNAFVKEFGPINKAEISFRRPTSIQEESARAEAREEARFNGKRFDDGEFDTTPLLDKGAKLAELARARKAAREEAQAQGRTFDEGTFNPEEMPDIVIDKRPNIQPFMDDPESYRLRSIEKYDDATGKATKGRVFLENVISKNVVPEIKGVGDAMLYVLNQQGRLDLPEVARMAKLSVPETIEKLGEQIFLKPGTDATWETREHYLSGNVRQKLRDAQAAAETNPAIARNVDALKAVQPAPLPPSEIAAALGMPWIPTDVVEAFATDGLGLERAKVKYVPALAQWSVRADNFSAASQSTWGTAARSGDLLLLDALNRQDPKIYVTYYDENGQKRSALDAVATQSAQDKMREIKEKFKEWVYSEPKRTERLVALYNENFNNLVVPNYSGDYLTTPGIAAGWKWRPHQTRVIARIIQQGNTYMAHAVGAGKTSAMIAAVMEKRRLGLARKPMITVPNHMLGQFTKEFYEQYPTAKLMVADEQRFHTDTRKQFIADVANEDLDAVIITHSAFGLIPVSPEFQDGLINEQVSLYRELLAELGNDQDTRITRSKVENAIEKLEQRLGGKAKRTDQTFTFEEMGIDDLSVDEAHLFRKLDFATKMANVKGVSPEGSKASWDLFVKTRYLETKNPGHNLVLASGTPITNTMAELYTVSRYLQPQELAERGLSHFDAWASAFGDTAADLEQNAAGGYKQVTRFSKFVNIPELSAMVRQNMDIVTSKQLAQYVVRPAIEGGSRKLDIVEKSEGLEAYQEQLAKRMSDIEKRTGPPKKGDDIMLTVINDGRHAAIDMRLVNPGLRKDPGSKLNRLVDALFEEWKSTKEQPFHRPNATNTGYEPEAFSHGKATQMVFANLGIGTSRAFNVHKYIISEMVRRGVPKGEVAIISDYPTTTARQRLFNDMNDGKVRILVGSTAKMATGVNAQRRLSAIHNLDPLWYPADDEQRIGRGLRQGNQNPLLKIRDYSTKGTYDSTMWGMMERKARFIQGFFEGDPSIRDMDDLGEASQYEQAKAMTTNDPRLMQLTEYKQDLEKERRRASAFERELYAVKEKVQSAHDDIARATKRLEGVKLDMKAAEDTSGDKFKATLEGKAFDNRKEFGEALHARLDELAEAHIEQRDMKIAKVGGFDILARIDQGTGKNKGAWYSAITMARANGFANEITQSETGLGTVSRIENQIRNLPDESLALRSRISAAQVEVDDFTPKMDARYDGAAKIKDLADKVKGIEAQFASELAASQAKATAAAEAPADPEDPNTPPTGGTRLSQSGEDASGDDFQMEYTEAFDAQRESLEADFRKRLNSYGLVDVAVTVPDRLFSKSRPGANITGAYGDKLIAVALNGSSRTFTLDHESVHGLRDLNLFKGAEWAMLSDRARRVWRQKYNIDTRYKGLDEEKKNEEAIAEAFAHFQADSRNETGVFARAFDKLRNTLSALRAALTGHGFTAPEDVFGASARRLFAKVASGEVGNRSRDGVEAQTGPKPFGRRFELDADKKPGFRDPEVEKRFTEAKKGVGTLTMAERAREWGDYIKRGFTRHFINLPNTPEYSDLQQQLRKLEAAPEDATAEIVRVLRDMTGKMTPAELDLFSRKVVLDDLAWEASRNKDLPFGLHQDDIPTELAKVDALLEKNPALVDKVRQRKLAVGKIASRMVEVGVLLPEQVKNPAYYRHQVLTYAKVMERMASDGEIHAPRWASRINNKADINANLLEAEFDWLHKALIDIRTAETIQWIKDSKHNVREAVLQEARDANQKGIDEALDADMQASGELNDQYDGFKRTIAVAFDKVKAAIESGELEVPPYLQDAANDLVRRTPNSTSEGAAPPFELLTWMLDNNKPGSMGAAMAFKAIAGRKQWAKNVLGREYYDTSDIDGLLKRGLGPKDHTTWQPTKGQHMFTAKTLPEHVMDAYLVQMTQADDASVASMLGLTDPAAARDLIKGFSDTIRSAASEALMVGSSRFQLVVPEDVAATLDSFRGPNEVDPIAKVITVPLKAWKIWQLVSPRRVLKYNLNNLSGDLDAVIAGSPRVVKRLPEAVKELYAVMKGAKPSARYREAQARGVFGSGLTIQEVPDINRLDEFKHLLDQSKESAITKFGLAPISKVWRLLKDSTQFRENWLRYAAYLDYVDRIEAGEPMSKIGYGGSVPAMIDAVADPKDRAAYLARDLMGDYGNVSAAGQTIRRSLIPFWSWQEVNAKRYWRFTANAFGQGIGKGLATGGYIGATVGARTTAYLALRAFAMYGLIQMFNYLFHGDDQDKLDPEEQAQLHVILGHTPDGQVLSLRTQGALSDALGWLGFEDVVASLAQVSAGRASWADVLGSVAMAPIKRVAGSVTPLITEPVTLLTGRKFWPDPLHPTPVRDKWRELFSAFALENEYDAVSGKPSRGYVRSLTNAVVYSADPGEQAYNRIMGLAHDWERQNKGTSGTSDFQSPRSQALYAWRKALRYGDMEAATEALAETKRLGVRPQDRRRSLHAMNPLASISIKHGDRAKFIASLSPRERGLLADAQKWYGETFVGGAKEAQAALASETAPAD